MHACWGMMGGAGGGWGGWSGNGGGRVSYIKLGITYKQKKI